MSLDRIDIEDNLLDVFRKQGWSSSKYDGIVVFPSCQLTFNFLREFDMRVIGNYRLNSLLSHEDTLIKICAYRRLFKTTHKFLITVRSKTQNNFVLRFKGSIRPGWTPTVHNVMSEVMREENYQKKKVFEFTPGILDEDLSVLIQCHGKKRLAEAFEKSLNPIESMSTTDLLEEVLRRQKQSLGDDWAVQLLNAKAKKEDVKKIA